MITILEYAQLSAHIYNTTLGGYGNLTINHATAKNIPKEESPWYIMTDVDPYLVSTNHFYAQLYMKFDNGIATDAVVAVRGTVFTDKTNLEVDVASWLTDVLGEGTHDIAPPVFTNLLFSFVVKAHDYIRKYFPNISHLKFTGHSLGGALAQLMPLMAGYLGETVVFNSPGVGNIHGVLEKNGSWITNVNSHYGVINKIGKMIGRCFAIDVPNMEAEAKQLFTHMDKDDYQYSENLYRLADSLRSKNKLINFLLMGARANLDGIGAGVRLGSYISTYNSLAQQPQNAQFIVKYCNTSDNHYWFMLRDRLLNTLCTQEFLAKKLNAIITAQHSIDNMVPALQRRENSSIAYLHI